MNLCIYNILIFLIISGNICIIYYNIYNTQFDNKEEIKIKTNILASFVVSFLSYTIFICQTIKELKKINFELYQIYLIFTIIFLILIKLLLFILYYSNIINSIGYIMAPYIINSLIYIYLCSFINKINAYYL